MVGQWVQNVAMGWLVLHDLHGSATNLGLVALMRGASLVLVSPFGGYLCGRLERRRQLVIYTSGSAAIAAMLAVLTSTGTIAIWMVYITATASGMVEALAQPIRLALVFDSVPKTELTNAVALNSLGGNAMRVIGPSLGGVLIGAAGTQGAFQMQAAALIFAALITLRIDPSHPAAGEAAGLRSSLGGGLRYAMGSRTMQIILLTAVIPSVLVFPYITYLPVFARDVMHSDETGYGFLAASVGLGALFGGVFIAATGGRGKMGQRELWASIVYTLAVAGFALSGNLWLGIGFLAIAGIFLSIYSALNQSLIQLTPDEAHRTQVVALVPMMQGLTPFAAFAMGKLIDRWGPQQVVTTWTLTAALLTVLILVFSREMRRV